MDLFVLYASFAANWLEKYFAVQKLYTKTKKKFFHNSHHFLNSGNFMPKPVKTKIINYIQLLCKLCADSCNE